MTDSKYVREGHERILCLYFNNIGFSHVVMDTPLNVIEKGMNSILPIDNNKVMKKVKGLIRKVKPERVIIENYQGALSHKSKRVIDILKRVKKHSQRKGIQLSAYSREQIQLVFGNWRAETRYEIAEVISRNVEAFTNLLFNKPKYPQTEHYRSAQFDAASLGITHYYLSS